MEGGEEPRSQEFTAKPEVSIPGGVQDESLVAGDDFSSRRAHSCPVGLSVLLGLAADHCRAVEVDATPSKPGHRTPRGGRSLCESVGPQQRGSRAQLAAPGLQNMCHQAALRAAALCVSCVTKEIPTTPPPPVPFTWNLSRNSFLGK